MAKVTLFKCDKCDSEITNSNVVIIDDDRKDLCKECYDHLSKWINKKEKRKKGVFEAISDAVSSI